jgi:hypothetical protein
MRSLSRRRSHSASTSLFAPSPPAIARVRTASRNADSARRYGISTSSRCGQLARVRQDLWQRGKVTHVDRAVARCVLAPAHFVRPAFAEAEHAQHFADPARDALDDADVDRLESQPKLARPSSRKQKKTAYLRPARGDVHVRLGDELAQDVERGRRVERVTERGAERVLRGVETAIQLCDSHRGRQQGRDAERPRGNRACGHQAPTGRRSVRKRL